MSTLSVLENKALPCGRAAASASSVTPGLRILLLTPYTGGNLGDAAIQDAMIHHLRKRLPEPRIRLVTLSPRATSRLHGLPSFPIASSVFDDQSPPPESGIPAHPGHRKAAANDPKPLQQSPRHTSRLYRAIASGWRGIRRFLSPLRRAQREVRHLFQMRRLLKETDLLVVSGGGQIDDYWGGAFGHPYALFKWATLARISNIPVVFMSVGVCSLGSRWSRLFAHRALRLAAYRSYRDRGSKELLQDANFTHADPEYPDLAFSHPCAQQHPFLSRNTDREKLVIGVSPIAYLSPHGWPKSDAMVYERYLQMLGEFAGKALEAGHTVVLFTSAQMDQSAVEDLLATLLKNPGSESWTGRLRQLNQTCLDQQLKEIREMDFVVASRLHGIILSHLLGKPVLAISYDRKVRAHMEAMGQERFCLNLHDCASPQIWSDFEALGLESAAITGDIRSKTKEYGKKLDQQYDLLVQSFHETKSKAVAKSDDLPNLDFLRACAVLFVLGFHLLLFFPIAIAGPLNFHSLGRWGVLIFFVHTSLVLTLSLEREANCTPGQRLFWPFLVRRGFRILPLSIFIICVVEFCRLPVGHLRDGHFVPVHLDLQDLLSNIFLVQNITHAESATAPLWSLPYEMQMYLLLPALFLLVRAAGTLLPILCLWLIGFVTILHPGVFARLGIPEKLGLSDLTMYVPCFLAGIIAAKLMTGSKIKLPSFLWPAVLAGITMFYLLKTDGSRASICCLLLGAAIPNFAQISQPTVVKISQQIARYSYGIYLTQFICMWLAFQAMNSLPKFGQWIVFVLAVSLIPYALYHLIEAPMIQYGRRIASRLN
jgi:polysaccharide pyruvyl transferase WcaK-like protein/peptidoglycan/LPS O-acetylase OafA/YrhL